LISAGASQGFSFWLSFTDARCGASVYGRSASTESLMTLYMLTISYSAPNKAGERKDPSTPSTYASVIPLQNPFRKGTCAPPAVADKSAF